MIADGTALKGYTASEWDFLDGGFMLLVEGAGLIHYDSAHEDTNMVLIRRA